jgi:cytochrome P450
MMRPNGPSLPRALLELHLLFRPLECLDVWSRRYGDPFSLGGRRAPPAIYFSHPTAIRQILTADPEVYEPRRGDRLLRYLLGDNAIQYLVGERHQHERRLLGPHFHGEQIARYGDLMCEITRTLMSAWTPGTPFRAHPFMQEVTLRVISRALLGPDRGPRIGLLRRRLAALLNSVTGPLSAFVLAWTPRRDWGRLSPWGRLGRHKSGIDRLLLEEIRARRAEEAPAGPDILGVLIAARDAAGRPMTEQELRDEVMSLLFAGNETTSIALTWALHCIHQVPEVHERLRGELSTLGEDAGPNEIAQLPYLTAVVRETLRLYPGVFSVVRIARAPLEIMGYRVEAGTELIPCIYLTHRRADLYPEPTRFLPERFLERQYSPYEYLPFGLGQRGCIGGALAQFEMKLVLATILSSWRLAPADRRPIKPVRRGVFAGPPPGLRLVPVERR